MGKSWDVAIAERETELGAPSVARMARIFVTDAKAQLAIIAAAVAERNLATARRAAHDLSANAESLCFMELRQIAQAFESACSACDQSSALALQKNLAPLVDICVLLLRARYALT